MITRFGMLNTQANKGFAYPGYFLLDPQGVVRERFLDDDYNQRFTGGSVLSRLFPDLVEAEGSTRTAYFDVRLGASDREVGPGSRLTLTADLVLPPGMHLYAPGTAHYKPVELVLAAGSPDANPDLVRDHPTVYPPAHTLHLPVIDETVPVFTGTVRLSKDIVLTSAREYLQALAKEPQGRRIHVDGVLRYQACDDKKCYPPAELPLRWDLTVTPLDFQRAAEANRRKE